MFNTNTYWKRHEMSCYEKNKRLKQNKIYSKTKIDTPFRDFFPHFDGFACIHEIVMCHFTSFVLL